MASVASVSLTDLKGLAQLAAMARRGQTAGIPVEDLNRVIDEVNLLVSEGRLLGGCDW